MMIMRIVLPNFAKCYYYDLLCIVQFIISFAAFLLRRRTIATFSATACSVGNQPRSLTFQAALAWARRLAGCCIARSGKLDRARSRLYRGQILQENMRLKALAEIYTMHSFAQLCNLIFFVKILPSIQPRTSLVKFARPSKAERRPRAGDEGVPLRRAGPGQPPTRGLGLGG